MKYLIYSSLSEAVERSAQAGRVEGLAYYTGTDGVSRYIWSAIKEETDTNPRAYLEIYELDETGPGGDPINGSQYYTLLTSTEQNALLSALPSDWVQSTDV
tara:strand:- start:1551 stop:1853 length:303 start_codon:yes stop_codon:yes gene_type:complete